MAIRFDLNSLITLPFGIARLLQFTLSCVVLICIAIARAQNYYFRDQSNAVIYATGFLYFSGAVGAIIALILVVLYLLNVPESSNLPWSLVEFVINVAMAVMYLVSGIIVAVATSETNNWCAAFRCTVEHNAFGAAAFFCFTLLLIYGVCAGLSIFYRRSSRT